MILYFVHCIILEEGMSREELRKAYGEERCWQVIACNLPVGVGGLSIVASHMTYQQAAAEWERLSGGRGW
jgi:hypothetical protein